MSLSDKVLSYLQMKSTRSPFPTKPTFEDFFEVWSEHVICLETTEDTPDELVGEVTNIFNMVVILSKANLLAPGWEPSEFHKICNGINLILKGAAQVSVAQDWSFGENSVWEEWKKAFRNNVIGVHKNFEKKQ